MARVVCCSIELEPKTLSQVQLNHARELAADVVQKTDSSETSATFSEGLRPVAIYPMRQMGREGADKESEEEVAQKKIDVELEEEEVQQTVVIENRPCQCLVGAVNIETPDQEIPKEPLSAPF